MGRGRAVLLLLALLLAAGLAPHASADSPTQRRLVSLDLDHDLRVPASLPADVRVVEEFPFAGVLLVEGPRVALDRLPALPHVAGVYPEEPVELLMERERGIVRADPVPGEPWPDGRNVTVALVDSGLDATHPAFKGRIEASLRISRAGGLSNGGVDEDGHGTHVAGIVAGDGARSPGDQERGIAPASRLVSIDISEAFTTTSAVRAFAWIHENRHEHGIRVVSNSWGREKEDAHYDPDDPVIRASDALVADGLIVVFSAGNRGRDGSATLTTEATNPNVITVGAASSAGRVEPYSSRGPAIDARGKSLDWVKPDISAPGTAILSARAGATAFQGARTQTEQYYTTMNGTSMAAPQVAAAAALLLDAHPGLSPRMVAALLTGTARDIGTPGADPETGYGMLDVGAALDAANLLAGGERSVVSERRVPIHVPGTVTAIPRAVLLDQGAPTLPPQETLVVPLTLPEGSVEIDLWFNWSGPGSFDAVLVGPRGAVAFEAAGGANSLHLRHHAAAGDHRIEARPTGVSAQAKYEASGFVVVREERSLEELPAQLHMREGYGSGGGFFVPQTAAGRLMAVANAAPGLLLALAGAGAGAATLWWGRRRKA